MNWQDFNWDAFLAAAILLVAMSASFLLGRRMGRLDGVERAYKEIRKAELEALERGGKGKR